MHHFFREPQTLGNFAPLVRSLAGPFTLLVGHSYFGDLFLRDPESGEYGVLLASTLELIATGEVEECGFREQILGDPAVVREVLRPDEAASVTRRVGVPVLGEALFPVPLPALGGSGALETFRRGGLREHFAIVAQSIDAPA